LFLFPVSGFEPFAEHLFVHEDILQEPLVANLVEAGFDVAFQYPLRGMGLGERDEQMRQSISTTASFAKAVGVWVSPGFRYGCEGQRVERLHGSVVQGGNAQGAKFAVLLQDVYSSEWFGPVSVTFEVICGLEFLSVGSPYDLVYTGRPAALVGGYHPHGQPSGGARMR